MSTKKLTPEQLQTVEVIKKEFFSTITDADMHGTLDSLFTYMYLSEDYSASEKMMFLFLFKGFKRFATLMSTGEITNEPLKIKL